MWRAIRSWSRFCLFLGANALVLAALYILAIEPARGFLREQGVRIEQNALTLARLDVAAARRKSLAALDPAEVEKATRRFLQGDTESLAAADLLTRLRDSANLHAISFSSVTTLPPRNWADRRLVGARIEFTAPTPRVAELLASLENGPSFLFIRNARLASPGEGEPGDNRLGVTIEVYGVTRWPKG